MIEKVFDNRGNLIEEREIETPPIEINQPSREQDTLAMQVDQEYRLTLLELGVK